MLYCLAIVYILSYLFLTKTFWFIQYKLQKNNNIYFRLRFGLVNSMNTYLRLEIEILVICGKYLA